MVVERNGKLGMLDGSHRLMAYAMAGRQTMRCYCAVSNAKRPLSNRGDSLFLELRRAYTKFPEHRAAIMEITELLVADSLDGLAAVESYWVDHVKQDPELQQIARAMIARIKANVQHAR